MGDVMIFPDTWEEFEELYHITDTEQIYTNGARLIPSFRVKQWLEHMTDRKTEPQTEYPCNTCVNKGDHDGECSNCFMSSEPIKWKTPNHYKPKDEPRHDYVLAESSGWSVNIKNIEAEPKQGEWLFKKITDDYHVTGQCSICKERRRIDNFCPNCGAKMKGVDDE